MIEVRVTRVVMLNNDFVVLLRGSKDPRVLPIHVDPAQAHSIQLQLQGVDFPRPLTHDLFKNVLDSVDCSLIRVEVCDLRDHTFYARLVILQDDKEVVVDARPSDAIALALRCSAAICVDEKIMETAGVVIAAEEDKKNRKLTPLKALEEKLAKAIKEERYENAAVIRDEINLLNQPKKDN